MSCVEALFFLMLQILISSYSLWVKSQHFAKLTIAFVLVTVLSVSCSFGSWSVQVLLKICDWFTCECDEDLDLLSHLLNIPLLISLSCFLLSWRNTYMKEEFIFIDYSIFFWPDMILRQINGVVMLLQRVPVGQVLVWQSWMDTCMLLVVKMEFPA